MKNVFIRMTVIPLLLLTLGLFLGIFASGTAKASTEKFISRTARASIAAPNTNTVDCNGRSDLFQIYAIGSQEFCYANAGDSSPNIPNVISFCSGNNAGYIVTNPFLGTNGLLSFGKNQCAALPLPKITSLHIN